MPAADTLKKRARDRLLEELASGRLLPGARISEARLAREVGMSRGPVREAVNQLTSQGILDQIPGFGSFVRAPTAREMEELYEFREALESHAAFLAAGRINAAQLAALRKSLQDTRAVLASMVDADRHDLDETSAAQWLRIDAAFHALILQAAGSSWLQRHGTDSQFLRRIWCQRLDASLFDVRAVLVNSYRDHGRIVRALSAGNAEEARRWMLAHIQGTKQRFVTQVARRPAPARSWEFVSEPVLMPPIAQRQRVTRRKTRRSR